MLLHQLLNNYKIKINFAHSGGGYGNEEQQQQYIKEQKIFSEVLKLHPEIRTKLRNVDIRFFYNSGFKFCRTIDADKNLGQQELLRDLEYHEKNNKSCDYYCTTTNVLKLEPISSTYLLKDLDDEIVNYIDRYWSVLNNSEQTILCDLHPYSLQYEEKDKRALNASYNLLDSVRTTSLNTQQQQKLAQADETIKQLCDPNIFEVVTLDKVSCKKTTLGSTDFEPELYFFKNDSQFKSTSINDNSAIKIRIKTKDEIATFQQKFVDHCLAEAPQNQPSNNPTSLKKIYVARAQILDYQPDHPNKKTKAEIYFVYNSQTQQTHQYVRQYDKIKESLLQQSIALLSPPAEDNPYYVAYDTHKEETHDAVFTSCQNVAKKITCQDVAQTLKEISKEIPEDQQSLKNQVEQSLNKISVLPLGITVKRENLSDQANKGPITITRQTTEGNKDVANSEYIEVQDEVFDSLTDPQKAQYESYESGDIPRFYIRVHFKDDGTSQPAIDDKNVYYFDKDGNKKTLALGDLGKTGTDENTEFKEYKNSYLKDITNPKQHFTEQFNETLSRITCRQVTKMIDGTVKTTITPSQNEKTSVARTRDLTWSQNHKPRNRKSTFAPRLPTVHEKDEKDINTSSVAMTHAMTHAMTPAMTHAMTQKGEENKTIGVTQRTPPQNGAKTNSSLTEDSTQIKPSSDKDPFADWSEWSQKGHDQAVTDYFCQLWEMNKGSGLNFLFLLDITSPEKTLDYEEIINFLRKFTHYETLYAKSQSEFNIEEDKNKFSSAINLYLSASNLKCCYIEFQKKINENYKKLSNAGAKNNLNADDTIKERFNYCISILEKKSQELTQKMESIEGKMNSYLPGVEGKMNSYLLGKENAQQMTKTTEFPRFKGTFLDLYAKMESTLNKIKSYIENKPTGTSPTLTQDRGKQSRGPDKTKPPERGI